MNIFGWYAKADGKPYGVITTTWFYLKEDNYDLAYYDEKHILYDMEKRKATVVLGEDLLELVGFSQNFRTEGLGVSIELPYQ